MQFIGGPRDGEWLESEHELGGRPSFVKVYETETDLMTGESISGLHLYRRNSFGQLEYVGLTEDPPDDDVTLEFPEDLQGIS